MVILKNWFNSSGVANNIVVLQTEQKETYFNCSVEQGRFWLKGLSAQKQISVVSGENFRWEPYSLDGKTLGIKEDYIDITVVCGENIVGYAIIKVVSNDLQQYTPTVVSSMIFPQSNGNCQNVKVEQINEIFSLLKK